MQTITLPASDPASIESALSLLRDGEIVAFPTDTVYGLGASAFHSPGIIKLFEAKGRDSNKSIAVLIGNLEQLELMVDEMNANARKLVEKFWPGGLTIVVPKRKELPELLSSGNSIGIRMANHPVALDLCRKFGPIATTSANLSGGNNPHNAKNVYDQLNHRVPLILDGGECPGGVPSTVVDCTIEETRILRHGAIPDEQIFEVLA